MAKVLVDGILTDTHLPGYLGKGEGAGKTQRHHPSARFGELRLYDAVDPLYSLVVGPAAGVVPGVVEKVELGCPLLPVEIAQMVEAAVADSGQKVPDGNGGCVRGAEQRFEQIVHNVTGSIAVVQHRDGQSMKLRVVGLEQPLYVVVIRHAPIIHRMPRNTKPPIGKKFELFFNNLISNCKFSEEFPIVS